MEKTQVIILAGGDGKRFGGALAKQFIKIAGKSVLEHTLDRFEKNSLIDSVIVVVNPEYYNYLVELMLKCRFTKVKKILKGGTTRQESSYIGLCGCDWDTENVLFHDAVRPFVSDRIIGDVIKALNSYAAVDVAIPAADTIIQIEEDRMIKDIPQREFLMRGQTPQGFKLELIKQAYERFRQDRDVKVTDDCGLIVYYGLGKVFVVEGEERNIKITYPEDVYLADKLFQISSMRIISGEGNEKDCLKGKVAIIFGHSSGIGEGVYNFIIEAGGQAFGFSRRNGVDIGDYEQVATAIKSVYDEKGRIDYVINPAGVLNIAKLENLSLAEVGEQFAVNYMGTVNITKASIPYLRETGGSMTHFTSSSYTRGRAMYSIYSSTKAAVVNFVQAMAEELYPEGIRINVMNPERTKTPMRIKNFGYEPDETLLAVEEVVEKTVEVALANITGQVIDVRKNENL